ncbi:MAG: DsbA family oxidoreductase, partial [Vulcanimicrobiaceae bacterium]
PPQRNVNSRFALETAELIRDIGGDDSSGAFHHAVSRAFFAQGADISKAETLIPLAQAYGATAVQVESAWKERRYVKRVDDSIETATRAGVNGVPALAWPNRIAIVGMRPPDDLVSLLKQ